MAKVTHRYVQDHASLGAFLLDESRVGAVARQGADDILDDVQAEILAKYEDTGAMRESYEVRRATAGGGGPGDRLGHLEGGPRRIAEIWSEDPAALMNEVGSATTPARHILMGQAMKRHTPRSFGRR